MSVYIAYVLIVAHVVFGVLQSESNAIPLALLSFGAICIVALHIIAGAKEVMRDHKHDASMVTEEDEHNIPWVDVCSVDDIKPDRAMIVQLEGHERIAVFRHDNSVSAITNYCAHQGGPLGEGKVVDGCVTCPWHGYQYKPDCGQSPPPYTEKIATYDIRVEGRRVLVNPEPNEPGTHVEPAPFEPWDEEQQ
jgi:nitrite reductase/ring-hydroxylating ferredoxin subunit